MTTSLRTVARGTSSAEVFEILAADGAVIVEDLIPPEAVAQIKQDLAPAMASVAPGSKSDAEIWQSFHGERTVRFCGLAARSRAWVDHVLLSPELNAVAAHLLGPAAADYWLNTGQVMCVGPGEPAQFLHRDEGNWPEIQSPDRELTVSCMFALDAFTRENGGTVVVPGSHADGRSPGDVPVDDFAYAEMSAGSGMIYTGKAIHGAGHNATQQRRFGLHTSFVVAWLRPEEASLIQIDPATAARLPPRAQQLLGYSSYQSEGGGRLGLVDFEDAARVLEGV